MIYLDNTATTPIHPEVLDAMLPYLKENYGNAGAIYGIGREAANAVAKAREQVADLINCTPEQIIFTSGGSEANSLVFEGLKPYLLKNRKTHIITSTVEHDSVLKAVEHLCKPADGGRKKWIKSKFYADYLSGCSYFARSVQKHINKHTGLVSIMYVNNETGYASDVVDIGEICRRHGVLFHTDCVQALGSRNVDVQEIGCDFLSISGHKINAPKGIGALYAKDSSLLTPIIHGGDAQEFGYRGGTENVANIVGFGKACEILSKSFIGIRHKIFDLSMIFWRALSTKLKEKSISKIYHVNTFGSKIINIRFDGIDAETLILMLDSRGVCVSAGSACRSHESEPSRVLLAIGLTPEEARSSIRVSFSPYQTREEVAEAAKIIADSVAFLSQNNVQ